MLSQTQQLSSLQRQKIELENEIGRFNGDKGELDVTHRQRLSQLDKERFSFTEQLNSIENERYSYVVAPKRGVASGIQAVAGSSVTGRIPLLSIIPENQHLLAHLYIPASAIGFVERDQAVKLMYEAYDFRKFGAYEGEVSAITDVLFTPAEVPTSIALSEPSYRVTVSLKQQHVEAYGKVVPLKANMRLTADVVLASRRLYEWFIDPFTRFQKAE